jgi:hypothetical protein
MAQTQPAWMTNPATPSAAAAGQHQDRPDAIAAGDRAAAVTGEEQQQQQQQQQPTGEENADEQGWRAVPDPENPSDVYYWNPSTGETTWQKPEQMKGQEKEAGATGVQNTAAQSIQASTAKQQKAAALDEMEVGQEVEYEDRSAGEGRYRSLVVRIVHIERCLIRTLFVISLLAK